MIDLWAREPDDNFVDQTVSAALARHHLNSQAVNTESSLPHNQNAYWVHCGIIAQDFQSPPNIWCHACGTDLNAISIATDDHSRRLSHLNLTREGRLVTIKSMTTGETLHDCVKEAGDITQ